MKNKVCTLTVAGSDSGGGAGIQADLKTFQARDVFGTSVITCITAQNPESVTGIQEISPEMIEKQMESVLSYFPVKAGKTGMLFSKEIMFAFISVYRKYSFPLVVDPVMVASSGARLLKETDIEFLKNEIIPAAALVTPNADEAEILLGEKIYLENLEESCRRIYDLYRVPVLLKGGHRPSEQAVTDILFDGKSVLRLESPLQRNISTHGTGCTYSASVCAELAKGETLQNSVRNAKKYLHETLEKGIYLNNTKSLNHNV
ncbi:MAG TPA: bifunctional hydroxymethylpyrimidine kinase/phosphomethylpyrimidine kinase [Leptospiraceae bacterium]|nr:bifunctional hydroxymethylpyrimidine kinase/phosphomethylpyrimidine kinase [Leptospiraceae bacterium]HMY65722.1 bifunctional hydroxymethylpyrimidine kinase/phosphomethylpyrimidine kinase [Leptospiraceae bacterium]HMZ60523.1 bifunctional hydroxymethylpyrimidine kinase/phosphomethylpyrimidine kinase [Leptospiraceae bacterium]HNF14199.1 bifunctional hydroxymethylpyrimidine kinase/phosphomethylpyrimidine kinase [Leptospiraceae bacterium]HNF28056.1 bifunctional hydroxymethylpyrimidine kinase/phos